MDRYLMNPAFKVKTKPVSVDIAKYKERIMNLTVELFETTSADSQLQEKFMDYVAECVSYLYKKELNTVCQAEYKVSLESILEEAPDKEVTIFSKMMKKHKPEKNFPIKKEIHDI